jgi:hypothetical protein
MTKHPHLIMILTLLGVGFALGPLLAQSPTPTCTPVPRKACADWPCKEGTDGCFDIKNSVKDVFVKLLNEASNGPDHATLRKNLLCPANNFKLAHDEVENRLKQKHILFGNEHYVMFYEPKDKFDETTEIISLTPKYPDNRCIHIFGLPEENTPIPNDTVDHTSNSFNLHLKCCYKPW